MSIHKAIKRTEELRDELREITWQERKYHRNLELNKNRPALGEVIENESYTEEFVKSKAQVLKRKPLRIKEYQHLQNAFLQVKPLAYSPHKFFLRLSYKKKKKQSSIDKN